MIEQHIEREERGLPADLEAEQITLGCALLEEDCADLVVEQCRPASFRLPEHQEIFRAMAHLRAQGAPVDPVTVSGVLRERGLLERCGGGEYLLACIGNVPTTYHLPRYLDTVQRMAVRRAAIDVARSLAERMTTTTGDVREALDETIARLAELDEQLFVAGEVATVAQVAETMGRIGWLWPAWVPRGHLTIIAGQPGCGKSALALALTRAATGGAAWPDGAPGCDPPGAVLYCDTEGSQSFIAQRADEWGLDLDRIFLPGADGLGRVTFLDPSARALARRLAERGEITMIVVDSLRGALTGDENTSDVLAELLPWVDLAAEYDIALVVVHHYRKQGADRRRPDLDAVRGSSALVAVARSILALRGLRGVQGEAPRVYVEHLKSNFARPQEPLLMTLSADGPVFVPAAGRPLGAVEDGSAGSVEAAVRALRHLLGQGPMPASEAVAQAAEMAQCQTRTVQRAAVQLGVQSTPLPEDRRQRLWSLPVSEEGQ